MCVGGGGGGGGGYSGTGVRAIISKPTHSYTWPLKKRIHSYTWSSEMLTYSYTAFYMTWLVGVGGGGRGGVREEEDFLSETQFCIKKMIASIIVIVRE